MDILQKDFLETFFKILDAIPVSVYMKDVNGRYLGCNSHMLKMSGLKSKHEIIGKKDDEFVWKDLAQKLDKIDKSVLINGAVYEGEEIPKISTGEKTTYLTTKTPFVQFKRKYRSSARNISRHNRKKKSRERTTNSKRNLSKRKNKNNGIFRFII